MKGDTVPQTQKVYEIAEFKALQADTDAPGTFSAMVSVFGNVDLQGDIVVKGAFDADLKRWVKSGDPIPCVWSHDWSDPFAHIGFVNPEDIKETDRGLLVKGQLDVDSNPFAKQVYDLMKQRRIKEFSFAYDIQDEGPSREVKGANDLRQISIIEVGPTLKGANPSTELLGVKSALDEAHKDSEIRVRMEELAEKKVAADDPLYAHLVADPPEGHGMSTPEAADTSAEMHRSMHSGSDVGHEHADMMKRAEKLSVKNAQRLESMHATLLSLGYDGCTSGLASSSDQIKAEVQEDSKSAEESDRDKDLRLQALLAEMSE